MAEVGMQAPTKRKCQREGCPHYIPSWRNGRRVSARASWKSEGNYRPLDSGSAMLSNERISASMPNFAAIAAAISIRVAANA
jgi:hypothetical protein